MLTLRGIAVFLVLVWHGIVASLVAAWRGIANYLVAIWEYRYFWMSLVKAELQRRYRRSMLGLGWSLLQPVAMMIVLAVVYRKLFNMSFWDFAPLLLTGLAFWNFISNTTLLGCASLLTAEPYIRQQYVPMAIFPLRTVLTVGFHCLVSLAMALVFNWCVHGANNLTALLALVPTLFLMFLFGWSLALLAGFAHIYFPDTQHLAEVALQVLMFLTPIMYPEQLLERNGLGFMLRYSPLAVFLKLIREPILYGVVPSLALYGEAVGFVALFAMLAALVVARLEHRLIFAM
jgi:lipopolysaccharide transport system permease protein